MRRPIVSRASAKWAVVAVAGAAVAALLGAAAATAWATAGSGLWTEGYRRLLADELWYRFDPSAAAAAGVALIVVAVARPRNAPRAGMRRAALLALAGVALVRSAGLADAWRAARGPNVLLVSVDTLRADRLGAYGAALPTSPTIDRRLAAEGVLFERCYSQSPKTTPSHMTLLTSLYPPVHGVEMWDGDSPGAVLSPRVRTLAQVLKNAGYATAAFTGGGHVHRSRGFGHGFDVYKHGHQLERARRWLAAHRRRKFFLFFHTYQIHDPYLPPEDLVEKFGGGYRGRIRDAVARLRRGAGGGWEGAQRIFWAAVDTHDPRDVEFVARLYDAGIRNMDETTMAPLLDELDALGLARDTLVVFLSDHGEAFAEHGVFLHDDLYAETLHVPLILRFPGRLPAGVRRPERVGLVDVMPTILDLLGVPAPSAVEGRSLAAVARGTGAEREMPVVSDYSNTRGNRRYQSVRAEGLSYLVDGAREQLFATADDPGERRDVAAEQPAALAGMRERLDRWREQIGTVAPRFRPDGPGVRPGTDTLRQLRALGYVQ